MCPLGGGGEELHSFAPLKIIFPFPHSVVIMQFSSGDRVFVEHRRKQRILEHFMGLENRLAGFCTVTLRLQ